jgi:hypothetical protein
MDPGFVGVAEHERVVGLVRGDAFVETGGFVPE